MKTMYESPEFEEIAFKAEDIITVSAVHTTEENELPGIDPFG